MPSRRTTIAALGALAAAPSLAAAKRAALPRPATAAIRPPRLRPGDTVGLVEPAGFTADAFELAEIEATIRAMGLVPRRAPHLMARHGYLAGEDRARAADLMAMFEDRSVRALFAVRGGWGSARLLRHLDFDRIRQTPKLLIGFSDITALHMALAAHAGFVTIHGPNASSRWQPTSWQSFRALAFDAGTPTCVALPTATDALAVRPAFRTLRGGRAAGPLLGGNLTVLAALVGTPYLPAFDGAILFLEDVDEAEYRIDRMLTQLALAGILGRVAGVVFGQCTRCRASSPSLGGFTLSQVLEHHLAPLGVPAFQGANFGHVEGQVALPVGVPAEIDADAGTIRMLAPAVS